MSVVLFLRDLVSEERQCFSCIGLMLNIKFFFSHRSSFVKTLTYFILIHVLGKSSAQAVCLGFCSGTHWNE